TRNPPACSRRQFARTNNAMLMVGHASDRPLDSLSAFGPTLTHPTTQQRKKPRAGARGHSQVLEKSLGVKSWSQVLEVSLGGYRSVIGESDGAAHLHRPLVLAIAGGARGRINVGTKDAAAPIVDDGRWWCLHHSPRSWRARRQLRGAVQSRSHTDNP